MAKFKPRCGKEGPAKGKEWTKAKVAQHERFCLKCRGLAEKTETNPPLAVCQNCNGPLDASEVEAGVCNVCVNQAIADARAKAEEVMTNIEQPPGDVPPFSPSGGTSSSETEKPPVIEVSPLEAQLIENINALKQNQDMLVATLQTMKVSLEKMGVKFEEGTATASAPSAPANGNGNAPLEGGFNWGTLVNKALEAALQRFAGGQQSQLGSFKPLIDLLKTVNEFKSEVFGNEVEKERERVASLKRQFFDEIGFVAKLQGNPDIGTAIESIKKVQGLS